jgi:hypothetical protein
MELTVTPLPAATINSSLYTEGSEGIRVLSTRARSRPIYEDARNGLNSSTALNQWYERYGVSLCRQAHQRLGLP